MKNYQNSWRGGFFQKEKSIHGKWANCMLCLDVVVETSVVIPYNLDIKNSAEPFISANYQHSQNRQSHSINQSTCENCVTEVKRWLQKLVFRCSRYLSSFNYWRIMNAITIFKALFARGLICSKHICASIQFKVREEGRLRGEPFDFWGYRGFWKKKILAASRVKKNPCMARSEENKTM